MKIGGMFLSLATLVVGASLFAAAQESSYPGFAKAGFDDENFYVVSREGRSLWVLDRNRAKLKWRFDASRSIWQQPLLIGGTAAILDGQKDPVIRWVDRQAGVQVRESALEGAGFSLLERGDSLILFRGGPENVLRCLEPATGSASWTRTAETPRFDVTDALLTLSPAPKGSFELHRLDPCSGEHLWRTRIPTTEGMDALIQVSKGPNQTFLLFLADFGYPRSDRFSLRLLAVDSKSGAIRHDLQRVASAAPAGRNSLMDARLAISGDSVYSAEIRRLEVSGRPYLALRSIDLPKGKSGFRRKLNLAGVAASSRPRVVGVSKGPQGRDVLIIYEPAGTIWGIDLKDQAPKWTWRSKFSTGTRIELTLAGSQVLVGEAMQTSPGADTWVRVATCLDGISGQVACEYVDNQICPRQWPQPK